ncbi:hypothetical protein NS274_07750 [Pseudomonas oryzihabitans]|nr:hypothetical protein NS274_07750 [Pseudomonas psychrotolerans]
MQQLFQVDHGLYPGYEMSLTKIIGIAIETESDVICQTVADCLIDPNATEDDFYFEGQDYCRADFPFDSEEHARWFYEGDWHRIAKSLSHERRYFNKNAESFFESLLTEAMDIDHDLSSDEFGAIKILKTGSSLYRARIANDPSLKKSIEETPEKELGAPPRHLAANNRMSASGIPFLYTSDTDATCIAEVRPSIGDQVIVGRFETTKELRLFDFSKIDQIEHRRLSPFSPVYNKRYHYRAMLHYIQELIARPFRTGDTDYVMTQAFSEHIRYSTYKFDGVAFRSVQRSEGLNYVLFDEIDNDNYEENPKAIFPVKISQTSLRKFAIDKITYKTNPPTLE